MHLTGAEIMSLNFVPNCFNSICLEGCPNLFKLLYFLIYYHCRNLKKSATSDRSTCCPRSSMDVSADNLGNKMNAYSFD